LKSASSPIWNIVIAACKTFPEEAIASITARGLAIRQQKAAAVALAEEMARLIIDPLARST
jgi:hypothetical protein